MFSKRTYLKSQISVLMVIILTTTLLPTLARSQNTRLQASDLTSSGRKEIPDTPAGRRVRQYLDVLNSGDRNVMRDYITENYSSSFLQNPPLYIHLTIQMGFYYASGGAGYEFYSMGDSKRNEARAVLYNVLTGSWVELRIPFSEEPAHKINQFISFETVPAPRGVQRSTKLGDEEIVQHLEICLTKITEDDEFSGVVLLAKNGSSLFHKAYGLASKSYQVPNRLDTKFNIASVGKIFTAVAIAQLADQGKLSFSDPVGKYVPSDWLKPEISQKIQLRHLLTHTSGLGDYFKKLYSQKTPLVFRNLDDYRPLVADSTLTFEPGTKWSYSNTGALLLGVVIEKVTGQSYFDYVREHIYEPTGMVNTDAYEKDTPVSNRATGYMKEYSDKGVVWRSNHFTRVMKGMPSGGSFSTAEDMLKFDTALRWHKLLSPEYTQIVLTGKPELNSWHHGYGFFVSQSDAGHTAGHSGDGSGISCQFKMYLDSGYTVVVLSNYGPPAATTIEQVIHQMIASR
jgi:CubicO group peptidase (beta-lactamase class C family)